MYEFGSTTRRRRQRRTEPATAAPPAGTLDDAQGADDDDGDGAYLRCLDCLNWRADGRGGGRCRATWGEWAPPAVRAAAHPMRYTTRPDVGRWCLYGVKRSERE